MARSTAVSLSEDAVGLLLLGGVLLALILAWQYFSNSLGFPGLSPFQGLSDFFSNLFGSSQDSGVDSAGNAIPGQPVNLLAPHGTVNLPPITGLFDQTGYDQFGAYDMGNF